MSKRGDTAQNGGPPDGPNKKARKTRRIDGSANGGVRGGAKTIKEGRRNEQIFMERLAGRSARAVAAKHGLKTRQIHDIYKACREAGIAELELDAPWRAQRFAEEHLLELEEATNSLRELELRAQEQNNTSSELGALKQRIQLISDRRRFLQETGLMSGLRNLKVDAEVGRFTESLRKALDEHDIPDATLVAIKTAVESAPRARVGGAPAHWLASTHELEASVQRERDAVARERAKAELLRLKGERKDAERKQEQLKLHEEGQQRVAAQREKSARRFDEIQRENAASRVRRPAAETPVAEQSVDLGSMSVEDRQRLLGCEAPIDDDDS